MSAITPSPGLMRVAIEAARESRAAGDYAVGSVVTRDERVISKAGNRTHLDNDATQHAELIVLRAAAKVLGTKDLSGCTLYSTHEPCAMCMGAMVWARVRHVVFGATIEDHKRYRDRYGNERWRWRVLDIPARAIAELADPPIELVAGFMREECLGLFHSD
jgi:tRNA(Arg) A34 adenosine deaminase TadA